MLGMGQEKNTLFRIMPFASFFFYFYFMMYLLKVLKKKKSIPRWSLNKLFSNPLSIYTAVT